MGCNVIEQTLARHPGINMESWGVIEQRTLVRADKRKEDAVDEV